MTMDSKELRHLIREATTQLSRVALIRDKIKSAIGKYGSYAVQRLIEDYEYAAKIAGQIPDADSFLMKLQFFQDADGGIHLSSPDVELTWNETEKTWDGFKGLKTEPLKKKTDVSLPRTYHPDFDKLRFETNKKMLNGFPGSLDGLKEMFSGAGFFYEGEDIDFPTYLGVTDVYLDDLNGTPTVSIQDPEGSYTWDPAFKEWV